MSTTNAHISTRRHRSRIVTGWLTITAMLLMTVTSCQRQEYLEGDIELTFSSDTVAFDTVFTTMGTATKYVKVYNNYDDPLLLRSVTLEQGANSRFRLNVDGDTSLVARNVEIAPHDSMFIFVHANINPNASTEPFLVTDHIVFDWVSGSQKLLLTAYGRNAVYHIPDHVAYDAQGNAYPYSVIDCQQWNHQLPHVVYGYAVVDEGCTLSLTAGDEIYFGDDGHLWVYNGGTLHAQGTFETPVLFTSVRHDSYYDYLAGQWGYIWLSAGSKDNTMDWVVIENSFVGIVADTNVGNNPTLQITNSRIENCSYAGIIGQGATIDGDNLLVDNCGYVTLALQLGGRYTFSNSTFANYWGYRGNYRSTPSVVLNNYYTARDSSLVLRDLQQALFRNCIIYGSYPASNTKGEILFDLNEAATANIRFDHCLILSKKAQDYAQLVSTLTDSVPRFVDPQNQDYRLLDNSCALGAGDPSFVSIHHDLLNQPRPNPPAMGCYEYQDTASMAKRPTIQQKSNDGRRTIYGVRRPLLDQSFSSKRR